ncbi:MAG: DUF3592 domain-containing protein [Oscillospiraceae bacterium]|nr:DUF3592 domain-containing protein [Oscillospiraceae bacterium]
MNFNINFILELIPVLIGLLCVILAFLPERHPGMKQLVFTDGEVISRVTQKIYRHHSEIEMFAPVVKYDTEHGERIVTSQHFVPEWQYPWKRGDKIRICYSKINPDRFRICQDSKTQWRRMMLCTFGIGTILAEIVLLLQYQ